MRLSNEASNKKVSVDMTKKQRGYGGNQRGSVLIEFSLIAVSLSLLIALVVDVARMVFIAQVLQETARVTARELSLLPLSPSITFEQALQHPLVKRKIFDPAALVIEVDRFEDAHRLEEFLDGLPMVNRMLRPLMTFERIVVAGRSHEIFRFPGVVLQEDNHREQGMWSIGIPHTGMSGLKNKQMIHWKSVVEEIRENPRDPHSGSFSLQTSRSDQLSGLVAVRVNYPFQPMFMNWLPHTARPDSVDEVVTDESVSDSHASADREPAMSNSSKSYLPNPGKKKIVDGSLKEYQQILFGQAVFRREVFQ